MKNEYIDRISILLNIKKKINRHHTFYTLKTHKNKVRVVIIISIAINKIKTKVK